MTSERPLRGGCSCGRNQYIVAVPENSTETVQVLFDQPSSRILSQSTLVTSFLRVPLSWYRSVAVPFFPDETTQMIRRVFEHPAESHARRCFCGFCGSSLSYWSEEPRAEADYIQLPLHSLSFNDLSDLEELGLIPDLDEEDDETIEAPSTPTDATMRDHGDDVVVSSSSPHHGGRDTLGGIPWLDGLVEGSRLGSLRTSKGSGQSRDGTVRVEWEIVEWTEGDEDVTDDAPSKSSKRKLGEREEEDGAVADEPSQMEDVRR